jgi:hypothetical protein
MPDHLRHLQHLLPSPVPRPLAVPSRIDAALAVDTTNEDDARPTHFEPPTKVRFPNKRMTMPEMKKRARNVLEYLARIQIEMSERERRSELLAAGAAAASGSSGSSARVGGATPRAAGGAGAGMDAGGEATTNSESMMMMDSLTKDVILFQRRYFGTLD